jgi:single-strand DNA-binding protein
MLNKVILIGRLATDPELKWTPSGVAVTNFRIAVDRPYTDAQGERPTDFFTVVAWRQTAEFAANYVTKGRLVSVEGSIQSRSWQTPDGSRRSVVEVVADRLQTLERDRDRDQGERGGQQGGQQGGPGGGSGSGGQSGGGADPNYEHDPFAEE